MKATERLVAAGVAQEYLDRLVVHAVLDDDNVAHQPDCEWAPDGELISAGQLLDAIPCPDCQALSAIVPAEPRVELLEEVLVARQAAEDETLPDDPVVTRSLLRSVETTRADLALYLPPPEELREAAEDAVSALEIRTRELTQHLRGLQGAVLARCRETLGITDDGPLLASGIVGWVDRVSTNRLVDAIVAVYGHETEDQDGVVVVAPEVVHLVLMNSRLPRRAGAMTAPVVVPQDSDPDVLAEVVAGIWEPLGAGPLGELPEAVGTALAVV